MIDGGVVEGQLAAKFEKNQGFYANRSYQVFDDPDWAEKVPQEVRNKAKAFLRRQIKRRERPDLFGGTLSEEELERRAQRLIQELLHREEDSPLQFLASGKIGSQDLSILQKREKIAPEIRALLGEFENPRVNYGRSVSKMAHLLENHAFLRDVREQGLGRFLFEPEDAPPEAHAEIAAEGSAVMEPLAGLRTTPEIKEAFEELPQQTGPLFRWYMKALGAVKAGKTVFSPMTHVRNFIGNPMFLVANGNNPFRSWKEAAAAPSANVDVMERIADRLGGDIESARSYFRRMQRLGVVDESARAGEMRDIVRDAMENGARNHTPRPATNVQEEIGQKARKFGRESVNLYQSEDDFWKIVAFENEKTKYREALPEAAEEEIERRAANIVRSTMPTYSIVPRAVKKLRRFPFTGTFVSFPAEVVRTAWNSLRLTKEELAHSNPAIRKIGARRLAGLTAAATSVPAITEASGFITGVTEDAKEDIRRFLPPWSENSNIFFLGRDEEGRVQWIDVSYTDPYQYLRKPVMAFLRGDDWQGATIDAFSEFFKPFLEEEILTSKVISAARNTKQTGGRVYNPAADGATVARQLSEHFWEAFEPGGIRSARRIFQGFTGETTDYGRTYDPEQEIAATLTGIRWNGLDVQRSLSFQARDRAQRIRDAESMVTSAAASHSELSADELATTYREAERNRRTAWEEAHEDAQAALRLGVPRETVLRTLDAAGFSESDARLILRGRYRPYRPGAQFFDRRIGEAVASEDREEFMERRRQLRSREAVLDSVSRQRMRKLRKSR